MEITIVQHPHGVTVVAAPNQIQTLNVPHDPTLAGQPIRVSEAAEKYQISQPTLTRWADRGLIKIVRRAPRVLELDEGDVKLAVDLYTGTASWSVRWGKSLFGCRFGRTALDQHGGERGAVGGGGREGLAQVDRIELAAQFTLPTVGAAVGMVE